MSSPTLLSVIIISLQLLTTVLGADYLCKDFVVDAVAFEEDRNMYFFTSGDKYWHIKDTSLPAKYSQSRRLPAGIGRVDAAVMIDGISGCRNAKTGSAITGKSDKYIWIVTTGAGGKKKIQAFDAIRSEFVGKLQDYNTNDCIGRAKVEWESSKGPIDAMFALNYLYVFVVQNKRYSMVDCSFICTDPKAIGKPYDPRSLHDFGVTDGSRIQAMTKMGKRVVMFLRNTFYELEVKSNDYQTSGQLRIYKIPDAKNTVEKFFEVTKPGQCPRGQSGSGAKSGAVAAEGGDGDSGHGSEGGAVWIILIVMCGIFGVIAMAIIAFFLVKNSMSDAGTSQPSAPSKSSSNISSVTPAQSVRSNIHPSPVRSSAGKSSVRPSAQTSTHK